MGRIILFCLLTFSLMPWLKAETLNSRFAGSWYPGSKDKLQQEIKDFLVEVKAKKVPNVVALLLPHAGYRYSGRTAVAGIGAIVGTKYKRVIIIGPSHSVAMRDAVSIPQYKYYQTPLGKTPLDLAFIAKLRKHKFVRAINRAHVNEHSVQMELPLLQYILKNQFELVPIVVGQMTAEGSAKIAAALRPLLDEHSLVVVSSDFTHYGRRFNYTPFPLDKNTPARIKKIDYGVLKQITRIQPDKFRQYIASTGATVCGRSPVEILLRLLPPEAKAKLVAYDTSGRMTGSYGNSVSYAACVFTGKWNNKIDDTPPEVISLDSQKKLLKLARGVIAGYLKHKTIQTPEQLKIKVNPDMKKVMGAFVTLHKKGRLRGCIGEIIPHRQLWKAIQGQAFNAAFRDWRFRPVKSAELKDIDIEISALTPPATVKSYKDIKLGRDGIILSRGRRSAVFLPQVAPEQGWDLAQTLTHLAKKAGLAPDDWKSPDTKFKTFQAQVFGEKTIKE